MTSGKPDGSESEAPIDLKTSAVGGVFSALFRIPQVLQAILPTMLWWAGIRPLVLVFRTKKADSKDDPVASKNDPKYRADMRKRVHRVAWWILTKIRAVTEVVAGMHRDRSMYKRLLTWGFEVPVIGYRDPDKDIAIDYVGKPGPDGSGPWNIYWIFRPLPVGRFQVVRKKLADSKEGGKVIVRCVWITGKLAGLSFDVGPDFTSYKSWRAENLPSHIYSPPRFIVRSADVVVSAGLILSIIALSDKGFDMVKKGWQVLLGLGPFFVDLLHKILALFRTP